MGEVIFISTHRFCASDDAIDTCWKSHLIHLAYVSTAFSNLSVSSSKSTGSVAVLYLYKVFLIHH